MSLSIAVNGQRLAGQRFGVGRYIEYMLRHWATQLEGDETVSLFVRRPLDEDLAALSPRIRPVLLESGMSGLPWETLRLRGAAENLALVLPELDMRVCVSARLDRSFNLDLKETGQ